MFQYFSEKSSTLQTLQTGRGCKRLNEDMTKYMRHQELNKRNKKSNALLQKKFYVSFK